MGMACIVVSTDLNQVTDAMLNVVQETVQPTHVRGWVHARQVQG